MGEDLCGDAAAHRENSCVSYIELITKLYNKGAGLLQLYKEAELMINSWIKETGLANLSRSSLCRGATCRL